MSYLKILWAIYAVVTLLELVFLSFRTQRKTRRYLGGALALVTTTVHVGLLVLEPIYFGLPFFIVGLYRILTLARFVMDRMHDDYLYKTSARSSFVLGMYQLIIGAASVVAVRFSSANLQFVGIVMIVLAVLYFLVIRSMRRIVAAGRLDDTDTFSVSDLPSVTVAIPARNETTELEECIQSFLASTYQKLEIIVLDDCSHERTSDIIKKFAHKGVRFVQGSEPSDTWLAKNVAYEKLLNEATSDIIVFCGVDVRVDPSSLTQLMRYKLSNKAAMLSVLPVHASVSDKPSVIQFARYMWELVVPRRFIKRPPVLSTLWIADKPMIKKAGGFASVKRMVVPEAYFAKYAYAKKAYSFVIGTTDLGVKSTKSPSQQVQTALRVRYPQLHKRPENVLLTATLICFSFFGPVSLLTYGVVQKHPVITLCAELLIAMQLFILWQVTKVASHKSGFLAMLLAVVAPVADLWVMHWSMIAYEFGNVRWKDRNVCLPVMHVTPSLPPLK